MNRSSPIGTVYLVGAGPGDPGLITVRGLTLIRQADVVVYDYLANPDFLAETPPHCEHIYVGKRGRGHRTAQDQINHLLIAQAQLGNRVIRLKGGDPFIFGRGGEEAEALQAAGIPFEIVPGITSGIAAPAYAGIPLTHRDYAQDVTFITGHQASPNDTMDWPRLAQSTGTLVLYMGLNRLDDITEQLMAHGKPPTTPAALIRWGTTPAQHTVVGTLATIASQAHTESLKPPALVVIGRVVSLRDTLRWFDTQALFGKTVVVTRSRDQAPDTLQALSAGGARAILYPTIDYHPLADPADLLAHLQAGQAGDWLIFTSATTITRFFSLCEASGVDARALNPFKIAVIGEASAAALRHHGIRADCMPRDTYQAETLLAALKHAGIAGARVFIPSAAQTRPTLVTGLTQLGCTVDTLALYETRCPTATPATLTAQTIDWITFTSESTVRNFLTLAGADTLSALLAQGARIACIGAITKEAAESLGVPCHVLPPQATIPALIDAMQAYERTHRS